MTRGAPAAILALLAACPAAAAAAQDKPFLEEEKRKELERQPGPQPDRQDFLWDYGGWLSFQFLHIDDKPFKDERNERFWDLRLWANALVASRYRFYARLQTTFADFNSGEQFKGRENDWSVMHLDQGWVDAAWPEFATEVLGRESNLHARAGRQFLILGSGLLLNGVYDGVEADCFRGPIYGRLFGAHTIVSENDIDHSIPNPDFSHRLFFGGEADYNGFGAHRPYAMALVERDRNPDNDPLIDYTYDAWYFGLGIHGNAFFRGFGYLAEAVYEGGRSTAADTTTEEAIHAFALVTNVEYYAPVKWSPLIFFSYYWGTGDKDRTSPTDTTAGNRLGTDDTSFLSFGYLQTGFALSPHVSNIRILRFGGSWRPFEETPLFRTLELGAAFYNYTKDRKPEGITDPRAFQSSVSLGNEVDVYVRWRILSDLGASMNFGHFMPGRAYADRTDRNFLSLGLTYSF